MRIFSPKTKNGLGKDAFGSRIVGMFTEDLWIIAAFASVVRT